jgi:tRNA 2-thiouridine synthesizing protein A
MNRHRTPKPTTRWDAGETGCGQLIVELRRKLRQLSKGQSLEVIARDAGAPLDLAAWCRMTGHDLISENHPIYVIRRSDS